MLSFLREEVPRNWANLRDSVTDNFRVISSNDFRGYGVNGVYKILKYRAKCATRALQAESDERGLIWGFGQ